MEAQLQNMYSVSGSGFRRPISLRLSRCTADERDTLVCRALVAYVKNAFGEALKCKSILMLVWHTQRRHAAISGVRLK